MSLEVHAGRSTIARRQTVRTWGEVAPTGERSSIVRFVQPDRVVTIMADDIRRWEHLQGEPEQLILTVGREQFTVEGIYLSELRIALELRRLTEVRPNFTSPTRPGPRIRAITIEPA